MSDTPQTGEGLCGPQELSEATLELAKIFPEYAVQATGSVYMLGYGRDVDVLVRVDTLGLRSRLIQRGFTVCAATEYGDAVNSHWIALRRGNINAILVEDWSLFQRWMAAARVCKLLQVTNKRMRVVLHEMIKNHRTYEEALCKTVHLS